MSSKPPPDPPPITVTTVTYTKDPARRRRVDQLIAEILAGKYQVPEQDTPTAAD